MQMYMQIYLEELARDWGDLVNPNSIGGRWGEGWGPGKAGLAVGCLLVTPFSGSSEFGLYVFRLIGRDPPPGPPTVEGHLLDSESTSISGLLLLFKNHLHRNIQNSVGANIGIVALPR